MKLTGKTAFVTGGGRGIGRAIAEALVEEGAQIVICSRSRETVDRTAKELSSKERRAVGTVMDMRDRTMFPVMAEFVQKQVGRVDILVNNSGVSGMNPIHEANDALWFEIIDTNLTGMYLTTRYLLPLMNDGGRIINISSVLGKFGAPGYSAYCASKHGVIGFTRALAAELAPRAITVNAICPGWVDTAMAQQGISDVSQRLGVTKQDFWKEALSRVPLKRFVEKSEVAALAVYLASPESAAMTGQSLNICGGATTN